MSLVVGVTGGIGSGKTAVTDRFKALAVDIIDADLVARLVVEPGQKALQLIEQHFGSQVLQADGCLDRAWLRQKIFAEQAAREFLESVTHPAIRAEIESQIKSASSLYCILVSPLLFETSQVEMVDHVVVIDVPKAIQIARTTSRDKNSVEQVERIIAAQMSRDERLSKADDVIDNTQSLEQLDATVSQLNEKFIELCKEN